MTPTNQQLFDSENQRLMFIIERDDLDAAILFAKRGIKGYRSIIKSTKGIITKRALVISCIVYRRFLNANGVVWFSA